MAKKKVAKKKATKKATKTGSKKSTAKSASRWPAQKQVLFRPERLKYVRKLIRSETCVFCEAREKGVKPESLLVATHGSAMLILNKYPYNAGHLLVLTTRHVGRFEDLKPEELADTQALLQKAMRALTELYSPGGFNMGLNLGSVAGAGIPDHLHWHLIPRWPGDSNFFPLIAETKVVIETLERTHERLVPYFT